MRTQFSKLSVVAGIILAAIVLAMVCPQPVEAQAQVIRGKYDTSYEDTFRFGQAACITEDVHVSGTFRWHTNTVIDAKGGQHVKLQYVVDLTAVGLWTGDRYSTQGPSVFVEYDFKDTSPREIFYHDLLQLVGPGRDGNVMIRTLFHIVVNANGVQTLDLEKVEILCH